MLFHVGSETLPVLINLATDTADNPRMVDVISLDMSDHVVLPGQNLVTLQTLPHGGETVLRDNLSHLGGDHHVKISLVST